MKMAGAVLVLLAALGIGFQNAARIRKSYEELVYLKKIMIMLRGEISIRYPLWKKSVSIWENIQENHIAGHFRIWQKHSEAGKEGISAICGMKQ